MDQTVEVVGWQADWISRTLPSLLTYRSTVVITLCLASIFFSLRILHSFGRTNKELKANPDDRALVFKNADLRLLKICHGHWIVATLFMLNVFIVAMVDAYIGVSVISKDVTENPEKWTSTAMLELGAYCLYLVAVFAFTFVVVPLLQMLCVTYLAVAFARRHDVNTLHKYLPLARLFSSHTAQGWAFACFTIMIMWSPASENPLLRYILLQATIGSAIAWLYVSFSLNFRADKLVDEDLTLSTGGVTEIIRVFGKVAEKTQTLKKDGDMLPRYEEVSQHVMVEKIDVKTQV